MAKRKNEITVDIGRFLTDVGSSLYKSGGTILDELVQNAQRAKAQNLNLGSVTGYEAGCFSLIEVQDDGRGLSKVDDLLKLANSGWSSDVVESDQPFGMGFWSTVTATSRVEVRSGTFQVVIDSDMLHATKSVKGVTVVEEGLEPFLGFRVRLYSVPRPERDAPEDRRWTAWSDLVSALDGLNALVKFMNFDSVKLLQIGEYHVTSHERVLARLDQAWSWKEPTAFDSKKATDEVPEGVLFAKRVNTSMFEGVIWPQANSWSAAPGAPVEGISFYAQARVVQSRDYDNVGGWLHLKPGAVNLRAPDRKDFVSDEKYRCMSDEYDSQRRTLLLEMATTATDEEMIEFDGAFRSVLQDSDVENLIPYIFGKGLPTEAGTETEVRGGELPPMLPREVQPKVEACSGDEEYKSISRAVTQIESKERKEREKFELSFPAVWVESSEEHKFDAVLDAARVAGFSIIVTRSSLQRRAMTVKQGKEPKLLHARDVEGRILTEADVKAPKMPLSVAKVLLPVLERLAHAVGAEKVKVGHLTFRKVLVVGEEKIPLKVKSGKIVLGMNVGETIFVDADYALGIMKEAEKRSFSKGYVFFRLLSTVAHERAHQLTPAADGTAEHLGKIEEVMHSAHDWVAENL